VVSKFSKRRGEGNIGIAQDNTLSPKVTVDKVKEVRIGWLVGFPSPGQAEKGSHLSRTGCGPPQGAHSEGFSPGPGPVSPSCRHLSHDSGKSANEDLFDPRGRTIPPAWCSGLQGKRRRRPQSPEWESSLIRSRSPRISPPGGRYSGPQHDPNTGGNSLGVNEREIPTKK